MLMSLLTARNVSPKALATLVSELVAGASGCCWAITNSVWALLLIVGSNGAMAGAGCALGLTCSTAWQMAFTASDEGSPSNKLFSRGVALIVPLVMNLRAHRATSGPNICNAASAESTTSTVVHASTSNSSLSNTQGRCQYFLAKSVDQTARIASVTEDESASVTGKHQPLDKSPRCGNDGRGDEV
uniref:Uncharacterized protein n=1 Tax=Romanomermis culicivorax TaxID=13658 RepID=A0A915IUY4_ROMCU